MADTKVDQPPAPAPAAASGQTLFARQSSGLVREISLGSAIALNVSFISIVYGVIGVTLVPLAFPGASLAGSVLVCTVLCLPPYLMYSYFSRAMPRSGGDFVFVSRGLHPWVGLAASINGTLWYMFAITYAAFSTIQSALSGTLASVGTLSGNHTLVTWSADVLKHGWTLGLGLVVIFVIYACVCVRLHTTLAITRWMFYVVIAGTVLAAAVLLFGSRADFVSGVAKAGGSYAGIVAASVQGGLRRTLELQPRQDDPRRRRCRSTRSASASPPPTSAARCAAARTSPPAASSTRCCSAALAMTIIYALAGSRIGYDFLGGSTMLSNSASSAYTLGAPSNLFFYVALMSDSTVIAVLLGLAFLASAIAVAIPAYLISTRALFAWSFDRFIPEQHQRGQRAHPGSAAREHDRHGGRGDHARRGRVQSVVVRHRGIEHRDPRPHPHLHRRVGGGDRLPVSAPLDLPGLADRALDRRAYRSSRSSASCRSRSTSCSPSRSPGRAAWPP